MAIEANGHDSTGAASDLAWWAAVRAHLSVPFIA